MQSSYGFSATAGTPRQNEAARERCDGRGTAYGGTTPPVPPAGNCSRSRGGLEEVAGRRRRRLGPIQVRPIDLDGHQPLCQTRGELGLHYQIAAHRPDNDLSAWQPHEVDDRASDPFSGVDRRHGLGLAACVIRRVLKEWGVYRRGHYCAHLHALGAVEPKLLPQTCAQHTHRRLAHRIYMCIRLRDGADDGGDVDQRSLALVTQLGQCGSGSVDIAHDVHVQDALEVLEGNLLERCKGGHGRAVDPNVYPAQILDCPDGQLLNSVALCHVSGHDQGVPSATFTFTGDLL